VSSLPCQKASRRPLPPRLCALALSVDQFFLLFLSPIFPPKKILLTPLGHTEGVCFFLLYSFCSFLIGSSGISFDISTVLEFFCHSIHGSAPLSRILSLFLPLCYIPPVDPTTSSVLFWLRVTPLFSPVTRGILNICPAFPPSPVAHLRQKLSPFAHGANFCFLKTDPTPRGRDPPQYPPFDYWRLYEGETVFLSQIHPFFPIPFSPVAAPFSPTC